ncbi:MAG: NRDE family protein [Puniceicoccales bacterium]
MCTATWMKGDRFRYLLFNRDESLNRPDEIPPSIHQPATRPRFLAPTDPQSGGSWIAVNEYGLSAAVLNFYDGGVPAPEVSTAPISRGTLPLAAVAHKRVDSAADEIKEKTQTSHFAPFHLLLYDAEGDGACLSWNGKSLKEGAIEEVDQPLSTSSYRSAAVVAFRKELYQNTVKTPPRLDQLLEFHGSFLPERPAYGPAMIRDDASTRSLTTIRLGSGEISMRHQLFNTASASFDSASEIKIQRRFIS